MAAFLIGGQQELKEGKRLAYQVWQARHRLLGPDNRDTLESQELYCDALIDEGAPKEATPIVRQIFEIRQRVLGPDDYETIVSLGGVGQTLTASGAPDEAEPIFEEAVSRFQRNGWADRREALMCVKEIAFARLLQGDPEAADRLLTEMIPRAERALGSNSMYTLQFQRVRARALAEAGHFPEAEALAAATLAIRRSQASDLRGTAYTLLYLGRVLVEQNKLDKAEPHLREALTIFQEQLPGKPELAAQAENWLGAILVQRQDYSNAETRLRPGADQFLTSNNEMSLKERRIGIGHVVKLYDDWGKPAPAAEWRRKLDGLAAVRPDDKSR